MAILYGNLAPGGAMVKTFSVPEQMHVHTGPARVFDFEEQAVHAPLSPVNAAQLAIARSHRSS